jgi:hypothetical protein
MKSTRKNDSKIHVNQEKGSGWELYPSLSLSLVSERPNRGNESVNLKAYGAQIFGKVPVSTLKKVLNILKNAEDIE